MENCVNITEAVARACEEPSLEEALSWICVWESERVVKQARENTQWETCFGTCIRYVLKAYIPQLIKNDMAITNAIDRYTWLNKIAAEEDRSIFFEDLGLMIRFINALADKDAK
jgi:hypothetical protein